MRSKEEMRPIANRVGYYATTDGLILSERRGSLKALKLSWNGRYFNVSLDGKTYHVHVLVCETFNGPRPAGAVCRHKDGNPRNNHANNVVWGTVTENNRDRIAHGTIPCGERHYRSRLLKWEVENIKTLSAAGVHERILATAFGVSQAAIKHIRNGRSWVTPANN